MDPDPQGVTIHSITAEMVEEAVPLGFRHRTGRLRAWIRRLEGDGYIARRATSGLVVRGWYASQGGSLPRQRRPWRVVLIEVDGRVRPDERDRWRTNAARFVRLRPGRHRVRLVGDDRAVLFDRDVLVGRGRAVVIGFVPPRPAMPWARPDARAVWELADVPVHRIT